MLKDKLKQYIGAKVPIIYVNSFDDNEVEKEVLGNWKKKSLGVEPDVGT